MSLLFCAYLSLSVSSADCLWLPVPRWVCLCLSVPACACAKACLCWVYYHSLIDTATGSNSYSIEWGEEGSGLAHSRNL